MCAVHLGRHAWQIACNVIFWVVVFVFLFVLIYFQASLCWSTGSS